MKQLPFKAVVVFTVVVFLSILLLREEFFFLSNFFPKELEGEVAQVSNKDYTFLHDHVDQALHSFYNALRQEYGTYTDLLFNSTTVSTAIRCKKQQTLNRLRRRLQISILRAQLKTASTSTWTNEAMATMETKPSTFTWVSAGDSNAAGHGNLFVQSYAVVLEKVLQPFFASLGISFTAKNYGFGSSNSAPEFTLCSTAIYGTQIDAISWDYAMSDGDQTWMYELWSQRMGVHPTSPIIFDIGKAFNHESMNDVLETNFIPTFSVDLTPILRLIPDSSPKDDSTTIDVESLPRGIKYFKCQGHFEQFTPCDEYKWNTSSMCEVTKQQVSWHTGWKDQLIKGYTIAAFLASTLAEALEELLVTTDKDGESVEEKNVSNIPAPSISEEYLSYLLGLEVSDHEAFLQTETPQNPFAQQLDTDMYTLLQRNKAMVCHTSLLPAQARFDGVVTQTSPSLNYTFGGMYSDYDHGLAVAPDPKPWDNATEPPLIITSFERDRGVCDHQQADFRDYFIVRQTDGWMTMVVPNDSEERIYRSINDPNKRNGVVVLCHKYFIWGEEPNDVMRFDPENPTRDMKIVINDVLVTGGTPLQAPLCYLLKHDDGFVFPESQNVTLRSKGQYEILFTVTKPQTILYISSVIVA